MRWVRTISAHLDDPPEVLGGKAHGLVVLHRLGLPVPAGFVVTTGACRAFLHSGHLPDGLLDEMTIAVEGLELATGRTFGGARRPLVVSVRSGAAAPMPGMMDTVLDLGLTTAATAALAAETGDPRFARACRRRFLASFAAATGDAPAGPPPDDAPRQLERALDAVFRSWDTPRARTYRELHGVPHDLGTAAIVQAMVFGDRDERSAAGVVFSRDPNTGADVPFGDVLFGHQGDDVVSGRAAPRPVDELADRDPAVWAELREALRRIEAHHRDACSVEFTVESGRLWFLQVRPGRFAGAAAVRVAADLADEGLLRRWEALLRVAPHDLEQARTPRIAAGDDVDVLGRGVGACPGVATGRVATSSEAAVRMAADGPVVLVRPETSPHDVRGLAAAAGVLTARGGPASHAAVVARAMGKPAVVGVTGLDVADAAVTLGPRRVALGDPITVDGTTGTIALGRARVVTGAASGHLHRLLAWADDASGDRSARSEVERLRAAHAALRDR